MMKKTVKMTIGTCLFAAAFLLGACGQSSTPTEAQQQTEAATEATTADSASDKEKASEEETDKKEETGTAQGEETEKSEETGEAAESETEKEAEPETEAPTEESSTEEAVVQTQEETTAAPQPAAGKSVNDVYQEITGKVALDSPMVMSDDFIINYYGIDVNTLDEYVFSMSESATSAETIVILKAKDGGSVASLSASLQTVIDQKRAETENYLPDQFQIVDKSSVQVSGNYVYLVISQHAGAINPIIQAGIQ